jgi:putative oxygen-independent coproporphyrinogen III oxidase
MTLAPGLYVHVPFCQSKCPYCDFYSITSPELISAYLSALEKEAQIYSTGMQSNGGTGVSPVRAQAKACGYNTTTPPFDSLYLGGGTPSLLDAAQLTALVDNLRRYFEFARDTEFTLEANPDDITAEKLRLYRDLGINRLSLGAQSFDENELVFLQRRHTARQTRRALELIRAAGFGNLGLDLMYGLPGQKMDTWLRTLETALSFIPEHLSCYQLTVAGETPAPQETPAPPTPFARRLARGEFTLPDEEAQRNFFLLTRQFLAGRGYLQYEVSNFARGEEYLSRHNRKYWNHTPYLGLGPAAHSFLAGRRWWNFSSVAQYSAALNAGETPVAGSEDLTPEQFRLEALYLGFRTREGVALEVIQGHPRWQMVLSELEQAGLVRQEDGRVTATARGLVVADRLPLRWAD